MIDGKDLQKSQFELHFEMTPNSHYVGAHIWREGLKSFNIISTCASVCRDEWRQRSLADFIVVIATV